MSVEPKQSREMFLAAVKVGKGFKWPNADDSDYVRLNAKEIKEFREDVMRDGYVVSHAAFVSSPTLSNWSMNDNKGRNVMFISHPLAFLLGDPKKGKADALIAQAEDKLRRIEKELNMAIAKLAGLIAKHRPTKLAPVLKNVADKKTPARKIPAKKAKR